MKLKNTATMCVAVVGLTIAGMVVATTETVEPRSIKTKNTSPQKDDTSPDSAAPGSRQQLENMRKSSLVLKDLVQTHPHEEIRHDLNRLVETEEILLNFQPGIAGRGSLATVILVDTPSKGPMLTFGFDPRELNNPDKSREYKQLVIYHEYQHIKQQRSGKWPDWLAKGAVVRPGEASLSPRHVRTFFEAESVAYERECKLAIREGWQDELSFAQAYARGGVMAMRELMANRFAAMEKFRGQEELLHRIARQEPRRHP